VPEWESHFVNKAYTPKRRGTVKTRKSLGVAAAVLVSTVLGSSSLRLAEDEKSITQMIPEAKTPTVLTEGHERMTWSSEGDGGRSNHEVSTDGGVIVGRKARLFTNTT
jgi:hypothetical protein